jgi:hypothetical protein
LDTVYSSVTPRGEHLYEVDAAMFGMLDYRAHKLYQLLSLPILLSARLAFFIAIAIGIWIAVQYDYGLLVRFGIAYVTMELIAGIFMLLYYLVMWIYSGIFFWLVDIIPSRGENEEEAREIVKKGRVIWLAKKLSQEIENWTYEDTRSFVSALNWRARLFFDARRRFEERLGRLQKYYHRTGVQPGELPQSELAAIAGDQPSWIEKAIVIPHFFNSLIGACLIILVLANIK